MIAATQLDELGKDLPRWSLPTLLGLAILLLLIAPHRTLRDPRWVGAAVAVCGLVQWIKLKSDLEAFPVWTGHGLLFLLCLRYLLTPHPAPVQARPTRMLRRALVVALVCGTFYALALHFGAKGFSSAFSGDLSVLGELAPRFGLGGAVVLPLAVFGAVLGAGVCTLSLLESVTAGEEPGRPSWIRTLALSALSLVILLAWSAFALGQAKYLTVLADKGLDQAMKRASTMAQVLAERPFRVFATLALLTCPLPILFAARQRQLSLSAQAGASVVGATAVGGLLALDRFGPMAHGEARLCLVVAILAALALPYLLRLGDLGGREPVSET